MEELYAKINQDWAFRGWKDRPMVLIHKKISYSIYLEDEFKYIAQACDGLNNFNSLAFQPIHREILKKWMEWGIVEACEKGQGGLSAWQEYRYADLPHIIEVHWAITGRCNMNCGHCFMEAPSKKYGEMPFEDIDRFSDEFLKANVLRISITGGEPLYHKDFPRIVRMLSDKGFCISQIVTNGSMVTEDTLNLLEECGQKPDFQISFDGLSTHDLMRGTKNQEEKVLRTIKMLLDRNYLVSVCSIFNKQNIHTAIPTYQLMCELGVSIWLISRAQKMGSWKGGRLELTTDEMGELCIDIFRKWLEDGKKIPIGLEKFYNAKTGTFEAPVREKVKGYTKDSKECETPLWRTFLLPSGVMLPCTGYTGSFLEKDMPSLYEDSFDTIWKDSSLRRYNEMTKQQRMDGNAQCKECEYLSECGVGCRSYANSESGSINAPDPFACATYKGGWEQRFIDEEAKYMEEHPDEKA